MMPLVKLAMKPTRAGVEIVRQRRRVETCGIWRLVANSSSDALAPKCDSSSEVRASWKDGARIEALVCGWSSKISVVVSVRVLILRLVES